MLPGQASSDGLLALRSLCCWHLCPTFPIPPRCDDSQTSKDQTCRPLIFLSPTDLSPVHALHSVTELDQFNRISHFYQARHTWRLLEGRESVRRRPMSGFEPTKSAQTNLLVKSELRYLLIDAIPPRTLCPCLQNVNQRLIVRRLFCGT